MDFQSRINQFRQGLKDQQDSYNSLAQSSAQYGRSIIPDKVAQHLTYMKHSKETNHLNLQIKEGKN